MNKLMKLRKAETTVTLYALESVEVEIAGTT